MNSVAKDSGFLSPRLFFALLRFLPGALGVAFVGFVSTAEAILVNGDFEAPPVAGANTTYPPGSALTGWSISGSTGIDHVRTLWQPAKGFQSISLNWDSPSAISQTVATTLGDTYRVSFAMAAESPAADSILRSVEVSWAGVPVGTFSFDPAAKTNTNMRWKYHSFTVMGSGADELKFESTTPGSYGPALDNVCVMADIVNGSLETPSIGAPSVTYPSGSSALTGWSISGDSGIDHVGTLWEAADGAQSISLNWESPSRLSQTVSTVGGENYRVSFSMAAELPTESAAIRTVDVYWGGLLQGSFSFNPAGKTNGDMGWVEHSLIVQGTGSDLLEFQSTTAGAYGPTLDDIVVACGVTSPTSVPLHSEWVLAVFALALLVTGVVALSKKASAIWA